MGLGSVGGSLGRFWSVASGGIWLALAVIAGMVDVPDSYRPVIALLPELLALLTALMAWRYRRSRLFLSTIILVTSSVLVKGPLAAEVVEGGGLALAAFRVLFPINLLVLVFLRDRRVGHPHVLLCGLTVVLQPVAFGWLRSAVDADTAPVLVRSLTTPQVSLLVFLVATLVSALALAMRHGGFDIALVWVLVGGLVASHANLGLQGVTMILAASQITLLLSVIEHAYRLAFYDQLTGLPGRRALDSALQHLRGSYVVAMADVDRFKRFNDRFGHESGDQALRMVAKVLRGVKGGGRAYRYGGEEFAILFQDTDPASARVHLEEVREALAARKFGVRAADRPRRKPERPNAEKSTTRSVKVTISIGLAGPGRHREKPADVLRAADRALYRAKKAGRNRVHE